MGYGEFGAPRFQEGNRTRGFGAPGSVRTASVASGRQTRTEAGFMPRRVCHIGIEWEDSPPAAQGETNEQVCGCWG